MTNPNLPPAMVEHIAGQLDATGRARLKVAQGAMSAIYRDGGHSRNAVPDAAAAALDLRANGAAPAAVKWVHYLAASGASARGPVVAYRTAIEAADGKSGFTCHAGLAGRGGSREALLSDHQPDDEIGVLFVE